MNIYIYIAVMALTTYLVRMLPLTVFRKPIRSRFFRSFLHYVPYACLAAMTFPAILQDTASVLSGAAALAVAIVLAFVTKEVYSSLLAGCVMGALLAEGFAPWRSFETLFLTLMEGIDRKIFFFDVLLGAIVVLFARSGGSRAFGEWASRRVRSAS